MRHCVRMERQKNVRMTMNRKLCRNGIFLFHCSKTAFPFTRNIYINFLDEKTNRWTDQCYRHQGHHCLGDTLFWKESRDCIPVHATTVIIRSIQGNYNYPFLMSPRV